MGEGRKAGRGQQGEPLTLSKTRSGQVSPYYRYGANIARKVTIQNYFSKNSMVLLRYCYPQGSNRETPGGEGVTAGRRFPQESTAGRPSGRRRNSDGDRRGPRNPRKRCRSDLRRERSPGWGMGSWGSDSRYLRPGLSRGAPGPQPPQTVYCEAFGAQLCSAASGVHSLPGRSERTGGRREGPGERL